jgi:hypothetical protein
MADTWDVIAKRLRTEAPDRVLMLKAAIVIEALAEELALPPVATENPAIELGIITPPATTPTSSPAGGVREAALAFINDLVHMQSAQGWSRAVVRDAAANFLKRHGIPITGHADTTAAIAALSAPASEPVAPATEGGWKHVETDHGWQHEAPAAESARGEAVAWRYWLPNAGVWAATFNRPEIDDLLSEFPGTIVEALGVIARPASAPAPGGGGRDE